MRQGGQLSLLLKRIEAEGHGLPDAIADGLELQEPWMDFFMNAFQQLSTDRRDVEQPIPWSSFDNYAKRYGVEGADFDSFVDVMRSMDNHFRGKKLPPKTESDTEDGDATAVQQKHPPSIGGG